MDKNVRPTEAGRSGVEARGFEAPENRYSAHARALHAQKTCGSG